MNQMFNIRVLLPLSLSLLLHALLAFYGLGKLESPKSGSRQDRAVTLTLDGSFEIDAARVSAVAAPTAQEQPKKIDTIMRDESNYRAPDTSLDSRRGGSAREPVRSAPERAGRELLPPRELNLSLPKMSTLDFVDPQREGRIFDPALLRTLNEQRKRTAAYSGRPIPGIDNLMSRSSFSSGRWESFLKVDNLCFKVIEADRLEPLSVEQWYQVSCD